MENPINEKEWTEFEGDLHFNLDFNSIDGKKNTIRERQKTYSKMRRVGDTK